MIPVGQPSRRARLSLPAHLLASVLGPAGADHAVRPLADDVRDKRLSRALTKHTQSAEAAAAHRLARSEAQRLRRASKRMQATANVVQHSNEPLLPPMVSERSRSHHESSITVFNDGHPNGVRG